MNAKQTLIAIGLALVTCLAGVAVSAQQQAVTRFLADGAYVEGSGQGAKVEQLTRNMPIFDGDDIWTNDTGSIGVFVQDGNLVWIDASSRLHIDQLPSTDSNEESSLRLKVWKGAMLLDLRHWTPRMASYLVATPSGTMSPTSGGLYLIEVESVDRSSISALHGSCVVSSADSSVTLDSGEMTYADYGYPPISPVAAGSYTASALLAFREDNMPRRSRRSPSAGYLPGSLNAYSNDFDDNGTWVDTDDYGYIWHPTVVDAEWSPYMYGRWWWGPGGMTWIPAEAWGWVPFHYGRWTFAVGIGWGWIPMPYYAPAWVAWYWGDAGWLGWCPLGYYGDPYWSHCGWYSVPVTQVYYRNVGRVIIHHHKRPPTRPIYPRPVRGKPGWIHKDGGPTRGGPGGINKDGGPTRGGTGIIRKESGRRGDGSRSVKTPNTLKVRGGVSRNDGPAVSPINLSPQRIRDYQNGRISMSELQRESFLPAARPSRRSYPSINPAPDRSGGRPVSANRTYFPSINKRYGRESTQRSGSYRSEGSGRNRTAASHRYRSGGSTRSASPSTGESGYRRPSTSVRSRNRTSSVSPSRTRGYANPSRSYRSGGRATPNNSRRRSYSTPRSSSRRSSARSSRSNSSRSYEPRYVPSRSSSGIISGSRSHSSSSGGRRNRRHR